MDWFSWVSRAGSRRTQRPCPGPSVGTVATAHSQAASWADNICFRCGLRVRGCRVDATRVAIARTVLSRTRRLARRVLPREGQDMSEQHDGLDAGRGYGTVARLF